MKHLSETELVDWLEGLLPAARADHARTCTACSEMAASLRSALEEAEQAGEAQPSPLFWDHFKARVSDAISAEATPAAAPRWTEWLRNPAVTWAASASLAMLLMVGALWRATIVVAPAAPPAAPAGQSLANPDPFDRLDDLDGDRAWAEVRSVADDLVWEDAQAMGITARPGSAERAVLELSSEERAELARLLESEMKRNGA